MVQNSLVKYIREQIRAGYSTSEIRDYLLRYGYAGSVINEAFQYAYPPTEVKHVLHVSKRMVAAFIAVVCSLILISAGVYVFFIGKDPSQLLDVQVDLITDLVSDGDLRFTTEIFNLGKAKRYDVSLRHEVYDLKDNLVTFEEETIALETRASSTVDINLEGIKPGNYYLRTTAIYDGKKARATSAFRVVGKGVKPVEIEKEVPAKRCPFSCEDNDRCTNDYCNSGTGYECRHDRIFPCCGNDICEDSEDYESCIEDCRAPEEKEKDIFADKPVWERIELIKNVAKSDKEKALEHCNNIEQTGYKYDCFTGVAIVSGDGSLCDNIGDESYKDSCYREFAGETKNSDFCAKVEKDSKRDQCYMDFATSGDYSVCDKLVNKYLKQSCDSLRQLSEVNVPY